MRKIVPYIGIAPKISGTGNINYCLWLDEQGKLYVQLLENDESGTFSKFVFSVSKYESLRDTKNALNQLEGYNIDDGISRVVNDNNNGAFLKAALRHLLNEKKE